MGFLTQTHFLLIHLRRISGH